MFETKIKANISKFTCNLISFTKLCTIKSINFFSKVEKTSQDENPLLYIEHRFVSLNMSRPVSGPFIWKVSINSSRR